MGGAPTIRVEPHEISPQKISPPIERSFSPASFSQLLSRAQAQAGQLLPCLCCFRGLRMALDKRAQILNACGLLVHLQQSEPLPQLRCRRLRAAREAFKNRVVGSHCVGIILLPVGDLAQVELRCAGHVVQRIIVKHVLELARGHIVLGGVVIPHAGLECFLERRSLRC